MRRGKAVIERRQREAKERQAERAGRSDEAQIQRLIKAGHGGCKEVERLHKRIDERRKA